MIEVAGNNWTIALMEHAPDQSLAGHVAAAVALLFKKDLYLLRVNANERSISHRLALYLEQEFPDWDVDCEYNRDEIDPKRLNLNPESVELDDVEGTTVYPDIIVHNRGETSNHLAIEIKKDSGDSAKDLQKLQALRSQLNYTHALFLRFSTGSDAGVKQLSWESVSE